MHSPRQTAATKHPTASFTSAQRDRPSAVGSPNSRYLYRRWNRTMSYVAAMETQELRMAQTMGIFQAMLA